MGPVFQAAGFPIEPTKSTFAEASGLHLGAKFLLVRLASRWNPAYDRPRLVRRASALPVFLLLLLGKLYFVLLAQHFAQSQNLLYLATKFRRQGKLIEQQDLKPLEKLQNLLEGLF